MKSRKELSDLLKRAADRLDALTTEETSPGACVQDIEDHALVQELREAGAPSLRAPRDGYYWIVLPDKDGCLGWEIGWYSGGVWRTFLEETILATDIKRIGPEVREPSYDPDSEAVEP